MNIIQKLENVRIHLLLFELSCSRSVLPMVLAQLLIQFQKPISVDNPIQNATSNPINDTLMAQLNDTTINRSIRSISFGEETINDGFDSKLIKERFVASENSNGKIVMFKIDLNITQAYHFLLL